MKEMKLIRDGQVIIVKIMAISGIYAMVRIKYETPFVCDIRDLIDLTYNAKVKQCNTTIYD